MSKSKMTSVPQLGDRKVRLRSMDNGHWAVQIDVFKANTLRGDAYWVTEAFKTYGKKADAERFASRFEQIGQ